LVETGSYQGDGIQDALDAGFEKVISFEYAKHLADKCRERFKDQSDKVLIVNGSSRDLFSYIKDIKEPITFWLDAHWSQMDTGHEPTGYCPVLAELEAISKHPIKTHSILVDDVRLFGTWEFDMIDLKRLIQGALKVNPLYNLKFLDGHVKDDIIAFFIPPKKSNKKCLANDKK